MTPEPVEALVERVREALELVYREHFATADDALNDLTELAERVKAAERERDILKAGWIRYGEDRVRAAEAQRDELVEALKEIAEDRVPTTYGGGARAMRVRANHALIDVAKVRGEAEPPGWGADRRCPETCG